MSKYTLRNFMLGSLFVVSSSLSAAEYLNINEYFHVNKTELDTQKDPKVSMDKDSGFAVVWINHHKDESGSTKDDIYVRFFDKNAKSISNELKVNDVPNQYSGYFNYSISSNSSGKTCVAFGASPIEGKATFVRCYNKNGIDLTGVILVDDTSDAWTSPTTGVKVFDDGSFVVVYEYERGFTTGFKAKRFSTSNMGSTEYWVNDQAGSARADDIKISGNKTGTFCTTWSINDFNIKTLITVVNESDEKTVTDLIIDDLDDDAFIEENPAITMHSNGEFAVTYLKENDSDYTDVALKVSIHSADGPVIKSVTIPTTERPDIPNIASTDNKIIVTWYDNSYNEIVRTYILDWNGNEIQGVAAIRDDYALDRPDQINPDIAISEDQKVIVWTDKYREEYEYGIDRNTTLDEGIFGVVTKKVKLSPAIINYILD